MNKDLPLVSIVTPSFNQGNFIEDTILSVKNQDYPNIEHIIVDGGSADNTLEVLRRYERTYNLRWVSEPDEGQSDAINKGFKMAKGDIIGWLNSDDVYFTKDVISYVVKKFKELKLADVIYGDFAIINEIGSIIKVIKVPNWNYKRLLRSCFIGQPSTFFLRKVILSNQLDKNLHFVMDYEFWLRLGNRYNFVKVNKVLSGFRYHGGSKSFSNKEKHESERKKVLEKYIQNFGLSYNIGRVLDLALLGYLRLRGISDMLELTKKGGNLAFKTKLPTGFVRLMNQLSFNYKAIVRTFREERFA